MGTKTYSFPDIERFTRRYLEPEEMARRIKDDAEHLERLRANLTPEQWQYVRKELLGG